MPNPDRLLQTERRLAALELDHWLLRIQMRIQYLVFAQLAEKDTLDACDYFAWNKAQEHKQRIAESDSPLAEVDAWLLAIRSFFGEWAVHLAGDHPPRMNPPQPATDEADAAAD